MMKKILIECGLAMFIVVGAAQFSTAEAIDFGNPFKEIGDSINAMNKKLGHMWGITELNKSYKNIRKEKMSNDYWKIRYPVITLDDKTVENAINEANKLQTQKLIAAMNATVMNTGSTYAKQDYSVTYQDDDYVSFFFTTVENLNAGQHGPWSVSKPTELVRNFSKVYSKKTGKLVPLNYFLNISGVDYYRCIKAGIFPLINNATGEVEKTMPETYIPNPRYVYLLGKGRIGIIFPGETHTVSEDDTHLATVISPEDIAKYRQAKEGGTLDNVIITAPMGPSD